jgi:hypothetical protein
MERIRAICLIAGVFFFALAFVLMGVLPIMSLRDLPLMKLEEIATTVPWNWTEMATRWPDAFKAEIGEPTLANWQKALRHGRDLYVGDACWHCHSQFVRPVSNESLRFGPVSTAQEYQNEMQMPVLFGTRRVGPDLTREGGRRPNDWHAAHFFNPQNVAPVSVMPRYTWFFRPAAGGAPPAPNRAGFSIIAYVQWLGTWPRTKVEGEGAQQ